MMYFHLDVYEPHYSTVYYVQSIKGTGPLAACSPSDGGQQAGVIPNDLYSTVSVEPLLYTASILRDLKYKHVKLSLTATNNMVHIPKIVCYKNMGSTLEAHHAGRTRTD